MRVVRRPSVTAGLWFAGLACLGALGCTDGTTPDCSDAQCLVVSVVEAGNDGAVDAEAGGGDDAAEGSDAEDGGPTPEAAAEAASSAGDAASDGGDAASGGGRDAGDGGDAH
jgi:hypothetical protein